MPRKERHRAQAEHNEAFARGLLDGAAHLEWAPVVTFYAAWHYAHAYFATEPTIPHSLGHDAMQRYFSTLSPLRLVAHHYFRLFNACNDARYRLPPVYRPLAMELVESDLGAVKGAILPRL